MDPADCARGQIVFTTDRVTIDVPAAEHISHAYKLVSSSTRHIVLNIDGEDSDIMLDANGEATGARSGSTAGSGGCRSSEHRRRHPSDAAADLVITTVVD